MIIAIILCFLICLFIVLGWIEQGKAKREAEKETCTVESVKEHNERKSTYLGISFAIFIASICFVVIPSVAVNLGGRSEYKTMQYERQCIIAEYSSSNANSQFFVYERAKDFNLRLMREKRTVKNKWINIYGSRKVASIEYIEFYGLSAPNE